MCAFLLLPPVKGALLNTQMEGALKGSFSPRRPSKTITAHAKRAKRSWITKLLSLRALEEHTEAGASRSWRMNEMGLTGMPCSKRQQKVLQGSFHLRFAREDEMSRHNCKSGGVVSGRGHGQPNIEASRAAGFGDRSMMSTSSLLQWPTWQSLSRARRGGPDPTHFSTRYLGSGSFILDLDGFVRPLRFVSPDSYGFLQESHWHPTGIPPHKVCKYFFAKNPCPLRPGRFA